ncbi:MAG: UDP-N-acetyl-D-mannosamine dehydrogenase [Methylococcaceae bacterium]
MSFKKISVIGLGYIGLPTAAIIASRGIDVIGVDLNQQAVDTINQGKIHIVEPDLDIVVRSVVQTGKLKATTIPEPADAFMIAVPTPFKEDHQPDLSYIKSAAKAIAPVLEKGTLIILESTSPVGATEKLATWLAEARPDLTFPVNGIENTDINIAYCPERVLPGYVLQELVSNDRVVGGLTQECAEKAVSLYQIFVKGDCLITNARTAEMAKLTENSFRDVNIAFANELSQISDTLDINVWELIKLSNRHPRVNILNPGPGVGGHCIAVDPWFIVSSDPKNAKLIKTAREVNDGKPHYVVDKVVKAAERFKSPIIACLGLSFKADIDDMRESPAVQIVSLLADKNVGQLLVVEPNVKALPSCLDKKAKKMDLNEALAQADIVLLLVDHKEFKQIMSEKLHQCITIDTRGILG